MDFPTAEEALKKSFGEVNPGLDDAALTKLAHTATNTLSALGRLTPEPPPEKVAEKPAHAAAPPPKR
jgi:hypothetical protein